MKCDKCGARCQLYCPWFEPPENHFYYCPKCDQKIYLFDPEEATE